jgi:lipoprotein-releasing system ATP-binding protein
MLEVENLSKEYPTPAGIIRILSELSLSIKPGGSASIVGPSGSGKSTFLHILGALEPPSAGTVLLNGENPHHMDDKRVALFRNRKIGFVFQDHHLLPQCTVLENVLIPTLVAPESNKSTVLKARELLEQVGLGARLTHRPDQLSGGEKQRVALARALVQEPLLVLCDEPTGNLDQESAEMVASMVLKLHRLQQNILIVVTHNLDLAGRFDRQYRLSDARLHPC